MAAIGSPVRRGAVALGRRRLGDWTARSTRSPASTSPARSRPTRRSTTATRAARCSTAAGRVLGHQLADPDLAPATARASASRSRSTSCARSLAQLRARRHASATPTSASRRSPVYPQLAARFDLAGRRGRVAPGRRARRPGREGRPARRGGGARRASRSARFRTGGDVDHHGRGRRRSRARADLSPGAHSLRARPDGRRSTVSRDGQRRIVQRQARRAAARHAARHGDAGSLPRVLQPVAVGTKTLADYTHIVGRDLVEEIRELAEPLEGRGSSTSRPPRSAAA